jgi:hypothetical protein
VNSRGERAVSDGQTRLKVLLRAQHLQEHRAFSRAYVRTARKLDPTTPAHPPSKATFYRWLSGDLAKLPHPGHCRILEAMFPGSSAADLFQHWDGTTAAGATSESTDEVAPTVAAASAPMLATSDLVAAFATRSEFIEHMPPHMVFDQATSIKVAGLSLNLLCQHYGDQRLTKLLQRGARLQALFLDPDGEAIRHRELEEGLESGDLSGLTRLNMQMLRRVRAALSGDAEERLDVRTYDSTIRFNLTFVDDRQCIAQPYLPALRGVDAPTFVLQRRPDSAGMYETFERVFDALWNDAKQVM